MREIERRIGGMLVIGNYEGINRIVFQNDLPAGDKAFCVELLMARLNRASAPEWLVKNLLLEAAWMRIYDRKLIEAKGLLLEAKALGANTSGYFGRLQEKQGKIELALKLYKKAVLEGDSWFQTHIDRLDAAKKKSKPLADKPPLRLIRDFRDAEKAARDWMRYFGFHDAKLTPTGRDGGVDVYGDKFVAQVKMEAKPTGAPVVQALAGIAATSKKKAYFFSSAGYTKAATDFAFQSRVGLFRFDFQGEPQPVNSHAIVITHD